MSFSTGWARLPREPRDTLFLLAALAWTLLPQLVQVPPWCAALAYAALGWRAWLAWRGGTLPSRWLLVLALLGATAGTLASHQSLFGPSAGVTLLVVMSALKTLELRARRDATVVFYLGFFLVLANFLHSQSLATALAMGVAVWLLMAALVLAHLPEVPEVQVHRAPLRQALALSARLLLTGVPLVVMLFVFFPRVAPLWTVPGSGSGVGKTGLSDHLALGDVAELAQDDTLALRLQFEGTVPATALRYFRGPVLSTPEGSGWQRQTGSGAGFVPLPAPPADGNANANAAPKVRYEMTVEPLGLGTLPLLENARTPPTRPDAEPDLPWWHHPEGYWPTQRPLTERMRLRATATLDTPLHDPRVASAPAVDPADPRWTPYLVLPEGQHPRTLAWADAQPSADRHPQWLLDHIRQQPYVYTLAPGLLGQHPVDTFWLDTRAGFCEHYASAVTVVLRRWGIPARIVTGYLGGEVNPLNGVLDIRQRDAHAWVEYWHADRGWVRLDPTEAVAPERVQRGERLTAARGPLGLALVDLVALDPQWVAQMQAVWGAAEHQWNQWILGYSAHRQQDLLAGLLGEGVALHTLGRWLAGGFAALVGVGAGWVAWRSPPRRRDPWLRGHARLQQILRQRGYTVPAHLATAGLLVHLRSQCDTGAGGLSATAAAEFDRLAAALDALSRWRYAAPGDAGAPRVALQPLWRVAQRAAARLPRVQPNRPATNA
jgi:protein-glutamine gamma-glutamyltransferase